MKYVAPEMEIVMFEAEEVIVASTANQESSSSVEDENPDDMGDF